MCGGVKWGRVFLWLDKPITWIAFWHKIPKNKLIDSRPVPRYTSTSNSPQEITKSKDTCYPLQHTGKSFKLDSIHRKDFILLVILSFNKVLIHLFVVVRLRNKCYMNSNKSNRDSFKPNSIFRVYDNFVVE